MYKVRIAVLLVLAISLIAVVNAVPDSVVMGPYKVSFDIGQKPGVDYTAGNITTASGETLDGYPETFYDAALINTTSGWRVNIGINYMNLPVKLSPSIPGERTYLESEFGSYWTLNRWIDRTIDKIPGELAEVKNPAGSLAYVAVYCLPGENDTLVEIWSFWPWYPDTAKLLDTIHIERVK